MSAVLDMKISDLEVAMDALEMKVQALQEMVDDILTLIRSVDGAE